MKSYISYGMVAFLLVGLLTTCSKGQEKSEGITLRVFAYLDRADTNASRSFDTLVATFKEEYPDIRLEFDYLTGEPFHNKLQAMNVSNQLPDVLTLWPGKRRGSVTAHGKIKDLRLWLDVYRDKFHPSALAPQGPQGEIYDLPEKITATHVMYTNTRLLKKLGLTYPKTLDELIAQGALIRKADYISIAMDNKDGWQMQSVLFSALLERTAGKAWLEDARVGKKSFSDREFVDALNVVKTVYDAQLFSPGINQAEYGRALTDFVNEKAVYFIDGEWRTSNLQSEASEELKEAIAYNMFPRLSNERGQANSTSIVTGSGYGMNAKLEGKKAEAAWKWIWFYSGPQGSSIKLKDGAVPAYLLPVPDDAPVLTKKLSSFIADTRGGYVLDDLMDAEGVGMLNTGLQEMMLGSMSAQELADKYEQWV